MCGLNPLQIGSDCNVGNYDIEVYLSLNPLQIGSDCNKMKRIIYCPDMGLNPLQIGSDCNIEEMIGTATIEIRSQSPSNRV